MYTIAAQQQHSGRLIVVPEDHVAAGLAMNYPLPGTVGQNLRIRSSTRKPGGRLLAVRYRGYWFYIDETDQETKTAFRLTRTHWSITVAGATGHVAAPVLTPPVSD